MKYNLKARYEHLSQFNTPDGLYNFNRALDYYYEVVPPHTKKTLMVLSQYSVQLTGVSHIRISTLANQIKDVSERTVKRHLALLEECGVIVKHYTKKGNGIRGATVYVFNTLKKFHAANQNKTCNIQCPAEMSPLTYDEKGAPMTDTIEVKNTDEIIQTFTPSEPQSLKSNNNRKYTGDKNIRIKPQGVDDYTYNKLRPFFDDHKIKDIFYTLKKKMEYFKTSPGYAYEHKETVIDKALDGLLNAVRDSKIGKRERIHNPIAYSAATLFHIAMKLEIPSTNIDIDDYIPTKATNGGYDVLYA